MKDLLLRALLLECSSPGHWSLFMLRLSGALSLRVEATGTSADKYLRRFFNDSHYQSQEHHLINRCSDACSSIRGEFLVAQCNNADACCQPKTGRKQQRFL